jgi:Na+-driven multidrug efflux pump
MFDFVNLVVIIIVLCIVFLVIKIVLVTVDKSTFTWKIIYMQFIIWGLNIAAIFIAFNYALKI